MPFGSGLGVLIGQVMMTVSLVSLVSFLFVLTSFVQLLSFLVMFSGFPKVVSRFFVMLVYHVLNRFRCPFKACFVGECFIDCSGT